MKYNTKFLGFEKEQFSKNHVFIGFNYSRELIPKSKELGLPDIIWYIVSFSFGSFCWKYYVRRVRKGGKVKI